LNALSLIPLGVLRQISFCITFWMWFLLLWSLADIWKKHVLRSPSVTQFNQAFCLHIDSKFLLAIHLLEIKVLRLPCSSKLRPTDSTLCTRWLIEACRSFTTCFLLPKDNLFQHFNFSFNAFSFWESNNYLDNLSQYLSKNH